MVADLQVLIPSETRCCVGIGQPCTRTTDCCYPHSGNNFNGSAVICNGNGVCANEPD